jgi:uncharacterized protein with HEPN domain
MNREYMINRKARTFTVVCIEDVYERKEVIDNLLSHDYEKVSYREYIAFKNYCIESYKEMGLWM